MAMMPPRKPAPRKPEPPKIEPPRPEPPRPKPPFGSYQKGGKIRGYGKARGGKPCKMV